MKNSQKEQPLVLQVQDLIELSTGYQTGITNFPLAMVNDHIIRISIMTEDYHWHFHPNSDETFLVIDGAIYVDLEERTVELSKGQMFTIPRNIKHRTRPKNKRSVNITFESQNLETVLL